MVKLAELIFKYIKYKSFNFEDEEKFVCVQVNFVYSCEKDFLFFYIFHVLL